MRGIVAGLLCACAVALAVGCGNEDEPVGSGDTGGEVTTTPAPAPAGPQGAAFREERWIEESKIASELASMRRDIRSFIEEGGPSDSLVFMDESGPRYFCVRKLSRGGPPPTKRLVELRRHALQACAHLQRALEASLTFKAGTPAGGNTAGAAQAARQAKAPAANAQALLDAARTR